MFWDSERIEIYDGSEDEVLLLRDMDGYKYRLGTLPLPDGKFCFSIWAKAMGEMSLLIDMLGTQFEYELPVEQWIRIKIHNDDPLKDENDNVIRYIDLQPIYTDESADLYLYKSMLELSTSVSDWTPAPEDSDESFKEITSQLNGLAGDLKKQIDNRIETWIQEDDPSESWKTIPLKEAHVGDLWHYSGKDNKTIDEDKIIESFKTYQYTKNNNTFEWQEYSSTAEALLDRFDGRSAIYYGKPSESGKDKYPKLKERDFLIDPETGTSYRWGLKNESPETWGWIETQNYREADADAVETAKEYTDEQISSLEDDFNATLDNYSIIIQKQADDMFEIHYGEYNPNNNNEPASEWDEEQKKNHVDDLYFNTLNGFCFRYTYSENSGYEWKQIQDADIKQALENAANAKSVADSKKRVFVSDSIVPPYDVGDLWIDNSNSNAESHNTIKVCIRSREKEPTDEPGWKPINDWDTITSDYSSIQNEITKLSQSINEKIGTKIETFITDIDISKSWNSLSEHVGDLWYYSGSEDTTTKDSDNNDYTIEKYKTYQFTDEVTTLPNNEEKHRYFWRKYSDGMSDLFDKLNGKKNIYYDNYDDNAFKPDDVEDGDLLIDVGTGIIYKWNGNEVKWDKVQDYKGYTDEKIKSLKEALEEQIDDKIQTWMQDTVPGTSWSNEEKSKHVKDLWLYTGSTTNLYVRGRIYIYEYNESTNNYAWIEYTGNGELINSIKDLFDKVDNKRTIYYGDVNGSWPLNSSNIGDFLLDDEDQCLYRWTGSKWDKVQDISELTSNAASTAVQSYFNNQHISLSEIKDQLDGAFQIHYGEVDPSEESNDIFKDYLATEKEQRKGDLYYNTETGKCYTYIFDGITYGWKILENQDIATALELAEKQRKVFVNQPVPPYYEGDLWIKSEIVKTENNESISVPGDILVCTTSNENSFSYNDWSLASKYTDDSKASELEGRLDNMTKDFQDLDTNLTELTKRVQEQNIEITPGSIYGYVKESSEFANDVKAIAQSSVNVLKDGIVFDIKKQVEANGDLIANTRSYFTFGEALEIGKENSQFKTRIDNQKLSFLENDNPVASISNNSLNITNAEIQASLNIGKFIFVPTDTGMALVYKG